jgi:flagellar FliL protein
VSTATVEKPKAKDAKAAPGADGEEPRKGKKKLLVLALVALVAVGAAAYFLLFSGGDEAPPPPEPGEVVKLDPIAVNLAGGGYLKIGIALQMTADSAGGHEGSGPDGSKALDLVISTYSGAQPADVAANREALKEALQQKIEEAYEGEVMGIYLTEYVTQ